MLWKTILPPGWAWFHITSRSQYKADAHVDLPVIDGKVNAITRRGICPYHHQYTMPNAIYFHLNRSSTLKNKYQESGSFRIFHEMCHMWYFTFLSRSPLNLKRIQTHLQSCLGLENYRNNFTLSLPIGHMCCQKQLGKCVYWFSHRTWSCLLWWPAMSITIHEHHVKY